MKIFFDMDGTIANLYGVENWLENLRAENTKPYETAKVLLNMNSFAKVLHKLQNKGHEIGIISWTSKGGSTAYNEAVKTAKLRWLHTHLASVNFNEIHIVDYGTPKEIFAKSENDILFDDEEKNRNSWKGIAYNETEILKVLRGI